MYGIMISYVLIPCKRELEKLEQDSDNHSLSLGHCSYNNRGVLHHIEKNDTKSNMRKSSENAEFSELFNTI